MESSTPNTYASHYIFVFLVSPILLHCCLRGPLDIVTLPNIYLEGWVATCGICEFSLLGSVWNGQGVGETGMWAGDVIAVINLQ